MKVKQNRSAARKASLDLEKGAVFDWLRLAGGMVFIIFALSITAGANPSFFRWVEELSPFYFVSQYFVECMRYPAGILSYLGTFFMQFFHYPWMGCLIFIAGLFMVQYLTVRVFCIPRAYHLLSFIPGLMLLLSATEFGYVWLSLTSPGYFFSNMTGVIALLCTLMVYNKIHGWLPRTAAAAAVILIGYPLFGFYSLAAGILCVLFEIISFFLNDKKAVRFIPVSVLIVSVVFIPLIYYYYIYTYTRSFQIYTAGLPDFYRTMGELRLWLPFIILFLSFIAFPLLSIVKEHPGYNVRRAVVFSSAIFLAGIIFTWVGTYRNENFRAEIKMAEAMDNGDWNRVIGIAHNLRGKPTRNIIANYRMALALTGRSDIRPRFTDNVTVDHSTLRPGIPLFMDSYRQSYNIGKINDAYHSCMDYMVKFGMRVNYLKYMVRCAIVNREYELANKYNAMLSRTLFRRRWAGKYQVFIDDPSLTENNAEFSAIRSVIERRRNGE